MITQIGSKDLVETVVYLGSLASKPQEIDPLLDPVRVITATLGPSGEITKDQQTTLLQIKQKISNYLITQEKVRVFTVESLQVQLGQHLRGGAPRRAALQVAIVAALAVILAAAVVSVVRPASPELFRQVAGTTFFAALHLGAAWLFASALATFTTQLRVAFRWICVGIVILGLSLTLQPFIEVFGWRGHPLTTVAVFAPPLLTVIAFFIGTRLYARLFTIPVNANIVLGIVVAVAVCSMFLPHAPSELPEPLHKLVIAMQASSFLLAGASVLLLRKVSKKMADLYRTPTVSLQFAISVAALVSLYTYTYRLLFGSLTPGVATLVMIGFVSVMGCAFLYSGYVFNKATRY